MFLRQLSFLPLIALLGCTAEAAAPSNSTPGSGATPDDAASGEPPPPACSDEMCEGDAVCKEGACTEPTAEQRAQVKELEAMLAYLEENTAWHSPIDWAKLA